MAWLLALALASAGSPPVMATPQRIVPLAPHLAELVCAAGGCARIAAVVAHTDWPPALRDRPELGDAFHLSVERLLALRPDLILAWDGGTPAPLVAQLRRLGLRVEAVRIERLADIEAALLRLGGWLGTDLTATEAARALRERRKALERRYAKRPPVRVFYQIQMAPLYTISGRSPISEAIALCGGVNIFQDLQPLAAPVSLEAVLARQPDIILHGQEEDAESLRRFWEPWLQARPPRARVQVHAVEASLLARPGPRMLDGTEALCALLERFRSGSSTR